MRYLHMADLHIKPQTWTALPSVVGDSFKALEMVQDEATAQQLENLILSGDVLDTVKPDVQSVTAVARFANCFRKVLFITGTHDNTDPPWLGLLSNAVHLGATPTIVGDDVFFGIDYCNTRKKFLGKLEEIKPAIQEALKTSGRVYLVLHNAFRHLLGFDGAWKVEIDDIQAISDRLRVIVGDVHVRDTQHLSGGGWIHSAGPLTPQTFDQGLKSCYVDIIDSEKNTITPVCTDVRNYRIIKLADVESFSCEHKALPTLVRVVIPPRTNDVGTITIPGCIVVPVIDSVDANIDGEIKEIKRKTIEEAIAEEYNDPEIVSLMLELYKSPDPAGVIDNILKTNNVNRRSIK